MGSRFWACREALTHPRHKRAGIKARGDDTVRQRATDIARGYDWPQPYTARVLKNAFVERWEGNAEAHREVAAERSDDYARALHEGDPMRWPSSSARRPASSTTNRRRPRS